MSLRIGQGFDAHAFAAGRKLILGGVQIPYERGLAGHSDADVLTHAICDALLGAAGLGDIGHFFPDTDAAYKDADSLELLTSVMQHVTEGGWRPVNIDATVLAQEPKLASFIPAMRERLAAVVGVETSCINIKASTTEQMGFTGRKEGIAAMAVVLIAQEAQS